MIDRFQSGQHLVGIRFADHADAIPFVGTGSQHERRAWTDPEQSLREMRSQADEILFVAAPSVKSEDRWVTSVGFKALCRGGKLDPVNE
jgi:hypothetical protein